jgi:hypothetical protein
MEGQLLWLHHLSNAETIYGVKVKATGDKVLFGGYFTGELDFGNDIVLTSAGGDDVFIAMYDDMGNLLWAQSAGGSGTDILASADVNDDGVIVITGYTDSYDAEFGEFALEFNGLDDGFLVIYNSEGVCQSAVAVGGSGYDYGRAVAFDQNTIYTAGRYSNTLTFGAHTITASNAADCYLASVEINGEVNWLRSFGGNQNEDVNDVLVDGNGDVWVTGWFMGDINFDLYAFSSIGQYDIYAVKYGSDNEYLGPLLAGSSGSDEGRALTLFPDGSIGIAGTFENSISVFGQQMNSEGYEDAFFYRFNSDFQYVEHGQIGGYSSLDLNDIASGPDNHVLFVGAFYEEIRFGNDVYTSQAYLDGFSAYTGDEIGIDDFVNEELLQSIIIDHKANRLELHFNKEISEEMHLSLFDLTGRKVIQQNNIDRKTCMISTALLPSGTYILKLTSGNDLQSVKVFL